MKINFTQEMMFGFYGPNLCLLGDEEDFKKLAKSIIDLTIPNASHSIEITALDFTEIVGDKINVVFASKKNSEIFGQISKDNMLLLFELDDRYWERLFKFFVFMSWKKATYYLNSFEDALRDLPLDQEVHLLCSSEF